MPVGIFSKGILRTVPYLEVFLQDKVVLNPKSPEGLTAVAGWGYKPTAKKAIKKAKEWGLPYLALEDGFIRSIGLGFEEPPLSLIVDPVGIYYDASKPSLLENILNSDGWEKPELLMEAERLRELILKYEISKYNRSIPLPEGFFESYRGKEKILVVDQTKGDMSVVLGGAKEEDFSLMLERALDENPGAVLFVKVHPDVLKGKKKGYLTKVKTRDRVVLIGENFNPVRIIKNVDAVYTVSSQMGFEGLILEREVHCFGIPFYAGWGLTKDHKPIPRRKKRRSLLELLAASYILYPRYLKPGKDSLGSVFDVVEFIANSRNVEHA